MRNDEVYPRYIMREQTSRGALDFPRTPDLARIGKTDAFIKGRLIVRV